MGERKNKQPAEFMKVVAQPRVIKGYAVTENEVDGIGSLNSVASFFSNLAYVFLGSVFGSAANAFKDSSDLLSQVVFWVSVGLAVLFGIVAIVVNKKSDTLRSSIKK